MPYFGATPVTKAGIPAVHSKALTARGMLASVGGRRHDRILRHIAECRLNLAAWQELKIAGDTSRVIGRIGGGAIRTHTLALQLDTRLRLQLRRDRHLAYHAYARVERHARLAVEAGAQLARVRRHKFCLRYWRQRLAAFGAVARMRVVGPRGKAVNALEEVGLAL